VGRRLKQKAANPWHPWARALIGADRGPDDLLSLLSQSTLPLLSLEATPAFHPALVSTHLPPCFLLFDEPLGSKDFIMDARNLEMVTFGN
jgi:hypothetical protein